MISSASNSLAFYQNSLRQRVGSGAAPEGARASPQTDSKKAESSKPADKAEADSFESPQKRSEDEKRQVEELKRRDADAASPLAPHPATLQRAAALYGRSA